MLANVTFVFVLFEKTKDQISSSKASVGDFYTDYFPALGLEPSQLTTSVS